jgi:hypothetical protein
MITVGTGKTAAIPEDKSSGIAVSLFAKFSREAF